MRLFRALPASMLIAGALALSGCGGSESSADDVPSIDSSEKASTPAESSPSQAAKDDAVKTSYPDAGVTYTALPDPKSAAQKNALQTLVDYHVATYTTLRQAKLDSALRDLASPDLVQRYSGSLDYQHQNKIKYAGTRSYAVEPVGENKSMTVYDVCIDATDSYLREAGKRTDPTGPKRAVVRTTLTNTGGPWLVTGEDVSDKSC